MSLLQRLLRALGYSRSDDRQPRKLTFELGDEWVDSLKSISEQERRSAEEVAGDLLELSLERHKGMEHSKHLWETLSPREKQITALICLGYTNPQIAVRLGLSVETVKTHVSNVRMKFDVHSKNDLRIVLADWDFSQWD